MTMTFSLQDNFGELTGTNRFQTDLASYPAKSKNDKIHLFVEQLRVPTFDEYIARPRLDELMKISLDKIGALLITGRAGTGKTALAANFAKKYRRAVWYSVEAADADWQTFASYVFEGINEMPLEKTDENVSALTENLFGATLVSKTNFPDLIVIDDLHNVFDTDWFDEFFTTALFSLSPKTHLIFLSRSKPACPLWRLRSKQVLSVIDEKMLAFNQIESERFCKQNGISAKTSKELYENSFGRIGKLKSLSESI